MDSSVTPLAPSATRDPWADELAQARHASTAQAIGRFSLTGDPLYLNRGMIAVLGGETPDRPRRDYLVNPTFARLVEGDAEGLLYDGWLTLGDGYRLSRTLRAQVYRRGGEVLIVGEYDVVELERLERELSTTNQQINNLQRELLGKNARLTQTLAEVEEQLRTLRDSEQRLRGIVEHIADPVMVTDLSARIRSVNPAFTRVTGFASGEIVGHTPRQLSSSHHPPEFYVEMRQQLGDSGRWHGNIWNRRKSGEVYVQRLSISRLRDSADEGLYIAVYNDIGAELRALEEAQFQAQHDALTGLPNRVLLADRLSEALRYARHHDGLIAVLFIDLDRFKPINDTHGHAVGDTVLQVVARRLGQSVRKTDTVARLGGDEFVVVLREIKAPGQAALVARKLLNHVDAPIRIGDHEVKVGASIGIAIGPEEGENAAALLHRADTAMYKVKRERAGQGRRQSHLTAG
jgi:diguanylate cyclase (GGDEF)-like protein/PAS domain S-box-containing protein